MKIIYVNWDWRNEYWSNGHSYEHYFSSSESKAWKKCIELWLKKHNYMIFIYLQSLIHHFEGLFGTNIMTNSQLACWLSW